MTLGHRIAVLDRGRLQQVAPPQELYDRPANAFVASFIGNPPMNVFPVRAEAVDGALRLQVGDQTLSVPGRTVSRAGGTLKAGIRPEAFGLVDDDTAPALNVTVEHVEHLGHETLAHVRVGSSSDGVPLVARLPGMQVLAKDSQIRLAVDPTKLYLFDEP
jgi:ABC-type sugar transport system ATPase subunit